MAGANQYKLTRKSLREPDEFQTLTTQAVDWFRGNQSLVVTVVSAVAAIAAVVAGLGWYSQRQADAAAVELQRAQALFEAKSYGQAATELAAVTTAYPRTAAGRIATLYRAHALAAQPDASAAATAYAEYLASSPATEYLRQEALLGLARANEATQKIDAAKDAYRQAVDIAGPFRSQAQLGLARLEEAAGHTEQAKTLYTEALKGSGVDPDTRQAIESRYPGVVDHTAPPAAAGIDAAAVPVDDDAADAPDADE
jgi:predicted negative regulator of RcsB-dependent stress response